MLDSESRTLDQALEFAVGAIAEGDPGRGRAALTWVLERDPENTAAWIWMACCVSDEDSRQECYRRASSRLGAAGEGELTGA